MKALPTLQALPSVTCNSRNARVTALQALQPLRAAVTPVTVTATRKVSAGNGLRQFAARSPNPSVTYQKEIEKVARGWDFLDELFDGLDRRHSAKIGRAQAAAPLTRTDKPANQRGQLVLPGLELNRVA